MKHWLEACIVILVIVILLAVSIPKFLTSQSGGLEKRIREDQIVLLQAINQYVVDYPQIVGATNFDDLPFTAGKVHNVRMDFGGSYGQHVHIDKMGNIYLLGQFLKDLGYIDSGYEFQYYTEENMDAFLLYLSAQERNAARTEHRGLATLWERAAPEDFELSMDVLLKTINQHGYTVDPDDHKYTMLLKSDYYFSITNGVSSFGYVYVDSLGNASYTR